MSQAAANIMRIYDRDFTAGNTGIRQGVALGYGADEFTVVLPSAANGGGQGICASSGSLPNGTALDSTTNPSGPFDKVTAQKVGLAAALVPAATTVALGQQAVNNANGLFIGRTQWSSSAFVWGEFAQGRTTGGTNPELVELDIKPYWVELVRPITGGCTGTIGAATKYLTAPGQAVAAAQIPLYVARFNGEVLRNLQASLGTAPGGADTVVFTVYRNPLVAGAYTGWAATTITCTISAAGVSASDLTHAVTLNQGDLVAIQVVSSNVTAALPTATVDAT